MPPLRYGDTVGVIGLKAKYTLNLLSINTRHNPYLLLINQTLIYDFIIYNSNKYI